jgi:hypothetical protein
MNVSSRHISSQLPPPSWILRASILQLRMLAIGLGIAVFVISLALNFVFYKEGVFPITSFAVSDGVAALACASLFVQFLNSTIERRRAVRRRLRIIAEMNHYIRNALDVIQMSAHTTHDANAIAAINDAVSSIDWTLREILGSAAEQEKQRHVDA